MIMLGVFDDNPRRKGYYQAAIAIIVVGNLLAMPVVQWQVCEGVLERLDEALTKQDLLQFVDDTNDGWRDSWGALGYGFITGAFMAAIGFALFMPLYTGGPKYFHKLSHDCATALATAILFALFPGSIAAAVEFGLSYYMIQIKSGAALNAVLESPGGELRINISDFGNPANPFELEPPWWQISLSSSSGVVMLVAIYIALRGSQDCVCRRRASRSSIRRRVSSHRPVSVVTQGSTFADPLLQTSSESRAAAALRPSADLKVKDYGSIDPASLLM
jgi:hypothetical protein